MTTHDNRRPNKFFAARALSIAGIALLAAVGPVSMPASAGAQTPESMPPGRRFGPPGQGGGSPQSRAELEQKFRARSEQWLREKVGVSDDQIVKLRTVYQKYEPRKDALYRQEREIQESLKSEVDKGNSADQGRVKQLLDQQAQLKRQRFELGQEQQKEVGGVLTPVQQAKLLGLQTRLRRQVEEMREKGEGPPPGGFGGPPPPPPGL